MTCARFARKQTSVYVFSGTRHPCDDYTDPSGVLKINPEEIEDVDREPLPDYTFDVHTRKGRSRGCTKAQFIRDEQDGLENRQIGFFEQDLEVLYGAKRME